ncbi:lamin tail domain-containing protein [Vibrio sp. NTOU-M3]|uniref:lamin tail domain-containing protein n=1 Tax=Vibrio sp. NTOU-M3 TaxID=3234954 RepID=UPI00349F9C2A
MSYTQRQVHQQLLAHMELIASETPPNTQELDQIWRSLNLLQIRDQIDIQYVCFRGQSNQLDENITLFNRGGLSIDISNWRIQAGSPDQVYIFPEGSTLEPYQSIVVDTAGSNEHSFNSNHPIWNNRGDLATLFDHHGQKVSAWAYGSGAYHDIVISHIHFDGEQKHTEGDEYIEISNTSANFIDLSQWRVEATKNETSFTFPELSILKPESSLRIYTNKADLSDGEYSFNSPSAIWNNQGGGAKLLDYQTREVSVYHY